MISSGPIGSLIAWLIFKVCVKNMTGFGKACLDMGPNESLVNSVDHVHMGRSEAPLTRDS
jgi:hypothetical protein